MLTVPMAMRDMFGIHSIDVVSRAPANRNRHQRMNTHHQILPHLHHRSCLLFLVLFLLFLNFFKSVDRQIAFSECRLTNSSRLASRDNTIQRVSVLRNLCGRQDHCAEVKIVMKAFAK